MSAVPAALAEIWEKWMREAAADKGVSVGDLERRLRDGEGALQITALLPSDKARWPCPEEGKSTVGVPGRNAD